MPGGHERRQGAGMAKKARGRPTRPPSVHYTIEINGWEWAYWIGRGLPDLTLRPVVESRNITIRGVPRGPKLERVDKAEIRIVPGWKLEELRAPKEGIEPLVGTVELSDGVFHAYQQVTDEAASEILQMLIADKLRFVFIEATPIRNGNGCIRTLSLRMQDTNDEDAEP